MQTNKRFKSSVFSLLFSEPDLLRELYCAAEYSAFVARARDLEKKLGSREEAVKEAVKYCEKHDILREFLKLHAGEVLNMLYTEWNLDDAIAVAREEAREDEKLEIARNLLTEGAAHEFI